jgi:hypothetical protein
MEVTGLCFLMYGQLLSIVELQVHWKYVVNHVRNSKITCSHERWIDVTTWWVRVKLIPQSSCNWAQLLSIVELQVHSKHVTISEELWDNMFSWKVDKCHYMVSQSFTDLSQFLQLVNAWRIELWDDYEHRYLKSKMESCCDRYNLMERCH